LAVGVVVVFSTVAVGSAGSGVGVVWAIATALPAAATANRATMEILFMGLTSLLLVRRRRK
jgi:hypothetical protein